MEASLYEELENAKADVEKLREQYQVKAELADNLKKSHSDQLRKIKEASSLSEKLVQELNEKDEAIYDLKHLNEELKSSLEHKEVIVKNLKLANDKLRDDFSAQRSKLEEESKALGLSLDDANARNKEHERNILVLRQEIDGIKRLLTISQKKCSESENKEFGGRDDEFFKLDEDNKKLQDQLKWKMEQFDHLKQAHEKLLDDYRKKETDSENKEQMLNLDDEGAKRIDQEQRIGALEEDIEGLKRLLTASEKKRLEMENKVKVEHGGREDVFLKLEERSKKIEDQMKWKKEQFDHLKDAHEKLREEFRIKEKEWEKEKNKLLDGISSLQEKLESQVRKSKELQSRVEFGNQALAHAETKRKLLEVEITELKTNFGNVCDEYEEAKSKFETINFERDQEIGKLRSTLATNNANYKEMEYQVREMEREKKDLLSSVKELEEARNQEADIVASSSKLQNKLKSIEQAHRGCLANLQAKESEWRSEVEKLTEELNFCKLELESKDVFLNELKLELQEARNQEAGIVSSSSKIQSKLKSLEQAHRGCLANLQVKESEWRSEMEKLTEELNFCKLESESKDVFLNELKLELQEARNQEAGIVSSSSKIQSKLKSLEQEHRGCLANLQAKESEWHSEMEKLTDELNFCKLELGRKDVLLNELMELQEARIHEANIISSSKLQNKLKSLEQEHRACSALLQAKEIEWRSKMEKLMDELNVCKLESERKDVYLNDLKLEVQEARIQEAGIVSSSSKLQNKLKSLKQEHEGCSANLQEKESEWRSAMAKLKEELDSCKLESETKDVYLNKMKMELEASESMILNLEMLNQESCFMLLVLKSESSEALADNRAYVDLRNNEMEGINSGLMKELEIKKSDFNRIQKDLEEEHGKVVVLAETVQNLTEIQLPLQKELEESVKRTLNSEMEVVQMKVDLKEAHEALDRANEELYLQFCEANEIEFELQYWKSVAEKLEVNLKQNTRLRREVEASLISQTEVEMNLKLEKEHLCHLVEEKDERIENLLQQLVEINEKETLHQLVEEKDQRISDLQHLVANLEKEFESSISSFSSKLAQMQEERNFLRESFEIIKADKVLKEVEIQEKDLMIVEMKNDLSNLQQRVDALSSSEEKVLEIRSELESEIVEKKVLFEDMSLLSERLEQLRMEEEQLMENIAKMVKHIDDEYEYDPVKENKNGFSSTPLKKVEAFQEERSPLKAVNSFMQKF